MKTFQSSRRSSNRDLTINSNKLLKEVQEWKISEEEICSDHKIIHPVLHRATKHSENRKQLSMYEIYNLIVTTGFKRAPNGYATLLKLNIS
jgi:hypothetical protein